MFTPIIIITQTFINESVLVNTICNGFFGSSILNSINTDPIIDEFKDFAKLQSENRIIIIDPQSKEDYRVFLSHQRYSFSSPSIMFCGNLSSYSQQLQEGMLRLLEEPPEHLQIILFSRDESTVIPTIRSRCQSMYLPTKRVFALLDNQYIQSVSKKLPPPSEIVKQLIQNTALATLQTLDYATLEREDIEFWFWQIATNLEFLYKKTPKTDIAKLISRVYSARILNQSNAQKKLVILGLIVE